ncbi:MAG: hypothetical protein BMS9Abin30_1247 [Gammaproteobacteria bacterium]|nr:MAG: hypothetical protein BMS9Abin30_1247 [Gammaproteobacteria bacterium]
MSNRISRTPLIAAFFYTAILTACADDQVNSRPDYAKCAVPTTPIASVQGSRPASPLLDQQVTVQGVVTLIQDGQGLYMEEPGSDQDASTSNAIFVQATELPDGVGPGSWVSAQGKVSEIRKGRNSLTALTDVGEVTQCSSAQALPLTSIALPLRGPEREALEGMRIHMHDTLTVTDTYRLSRGEFSLAGNGFQFTATEVMAPGPEAVKYTLNNQAFTLPAMLPGYPENHDLLATGSTISGITGVMAHDERSLRVSLQSMSDGEPPSFAIPRQAGEGELRVVGMNLLNFFNGDGKGGGFPAPRGARTAAEFDQQRQRLGAAIRVLNPQVLAVMELENDGFGPVSAAADFIAVAQEATGTPWQVARPAGDDTGTNIIAVGLFYRGDVLEALGPARTLTGPEFKRSRQPLAQLFKQRQDGEKILVVVNHLKSKGSCPDSGIDANQKDGQGCWNPMRAASAGKMSTWVNSLAATTQTANLLILGDMNAYRREDPINTIRDAGFIELLDSAENPYSFIYFGQAGTLDYAFATAALQQKVQQAFIWNVNAALPAKLELPQPWLRFSDHDPVVVDVRLHQSTTSD